MSNSLRRRTLLATLGATGIVSLPSSVTASTGAHFEVDVEHEPDLVEPGQSGDLIGTIENTGDEWDEQDIDLELWKDGASVFFTTEHISLDAGESETFTITRDYDDYLGDGEYLGEACSDQECDTTEWVLGEANFTVTIDEASTPVAGEPLEVTVTVENTGVGPTSQEIALDVSDTQRDATTLTLDEDETESVTLEWETPDDSAGEYTAKVTTRDDEASTDIVVLEPAQFTITEIAAFDPVTETESLEIDATIVNTGDVQGTQDVTLDVPELGSDTETVTLGADAQTTETLSVDTEAGDAGEYTATVSTPDDKQSRTVTVQEPADFSVDVINTNEPVVETEPLAVDATVQNTGDVSATQPIRLDIDDEQVDEKEPTVDADETTTVTLEWQTEASDVGEYTATVSSLTDSDSTTVVIDEAVPVAVTITDTNTPITEGELVTLDVSVENTGDESTTQPITLEEEVNEYDSTEVTLEPEESETVTLTWETKGGDAGDRILTVSSIRNSETVTVTIDPTEREVSDYTNENDVIDTSNLRDAIDEWRENFIESNLLGEVFTYWRTGEEIEE